MIELGFIGLGAMGRPMAANLGARYPTRVANRTRSVADQHASKHGTTSVDLDGMEGIEVLFTCLPTTAEVVEVAERFMGSLTETTVWVDCTSGDPAASRVLAGQLADHGIDYLDAPVSGGTDGAEAGTLTMMVGGSLATLGSVRPFLDPVARRVVHVGEVGAGHAVKAINNTLLAANLWAACEGLAALAGTCVDVPAALEVINHSSGRSFASQSTIPERVVTREFPTTFALGLLAKDTRLGRGVVAAAGISAPVLGLVVELFQVAAAELGGDVDHSAVAQLIEQWSQVRIE